MASVVAHGPVGTSVNKNRSEAEGAAPPERGPPGPDPGGANAGFPWLSMGAFVVEQEQDRRWVNLSEFVHG